VINRKLKSTYATTKQQSGSDRRHLTKQNFANNPAKQQVSERQDV